MVAVPVALGVKLTEQLADAPAPDSVQVGALKLPVTPATDQVTVPVGVVGLALVSVTVAVHATEAPTTTVVGVQLIMVIVACAAPGLTVTVTIAVRDWPLFEPVTVTVNVFGVGTALQLTVKVEVCKAPNTTLVGLRVAVHSAGAPVAVNVTVPVKPFTGATVIVEVDEPGATTLIDVGLAVTGKSVTVTVTVVVRDCPLFVPVTVTVYVPAEPVHDRVEVCGVGGSVTLVGVRVHVNPAGDTAEDRATVPANPFTPATEMVEVAAFPATTVALAGLAARVKFVTMTVTVAVLDWPLFVPVTVTV